MGKREDEQRNCKENHLKRPGDREGEQQREHKRKGKKRNPWESMQRRRKLIV